MSPPSCLLMFTVVQKTNRLQEVVTCQSNATIGMVLRWLEMSAIVLEHLLTYDKRYAETAIGRIRILSLYFWPCFGNWSCKGANTNPPCFWKRIFHVTIVCFVFVINRSHPLAAVLARQLNGSVSVFLTQVRVLWKRMDRSSWSLT